MLARLIALTLVLAAALPASASATFPGANGRLAVTLDGCSENRFIRAVSVTGAPAEDLTPSCAQLTDADDVRDTFGPDWSPDGTRLLFASTAVVSPGTRFATVAADGTGERTVSQDLPFDAHGHGTRG